MQRSRNADKAELDIPKLETLLLRLGFSAAGLLRIVQQGPDRLLRPKLALLECGVRGM